ncbi:MAG: hypothetical protein QMC98_02965 [Candidatus Thermoplasmatota archaeon]|nr:hypothetical protein [Candidatus Thermoplasmatota archaeon]
MFGKKVDGRWERLMLALGLIVVGIVGRILLIPYPNIETVMAVTLLAGCLLGGLYLLIVPLGVMIITDMYLYYFHHHIFSGFTWAMIGGITLFTWSGFALAGLVGYGLKNKASYSLKFVGMLTGAGIGATILYQLWVNFGWWYVLYPHTISNLLLVYALAIPFALRQIFSTIIFVPLLSVPILYVWEHGLPDIVRTIKPLERYATVAAVSLLLAFSVLLA